MPAGKQSTLKFAVTNHPKGDWDLVVRLDRTEILKRSITETRWQDIQIDLSKHAGRTITIELENRASGWAFEAAYWHKIRIETSP